MKVLRVSFLEWNSATWRDELADAVDDYLLRSREEMSVQEEWLLLNKAMLGQQDLLFLVGLDDQDHLLGFCLCRALPGTERTGNVCQIWQVYSVPGREKLADLFKAAWSIIRSWAHSFDAVRFNFWTRRMGKGYKKMLREIGFEPYALMYQKVDEKEPLELLADMARKGNQP